MNQKNLFTKSALAAAIALMSTQVSAAGFQLNEYSSSGLGRAYSGEGAVADNASVGSRNPAAMMMFDRPALSVGAVFIDPTVNIDGVKNPLGSAQSLNASDIAPNAIVPNAHFIYPVNEKWALGGSVTSNFGLATEFPDTYAAGAIGGKTDLMTANVNMSAAYRLNQNFSFGLGLDAVYAKAKFQRYAGELGGIYHIPANTLLADLEGDQWGFGWNAGLLYELNKDNRYALTYRSAVNIKFKDNFSNQLPPQLGGTGGAGIPAALTLNLPEVWEISGYNKVAPKWAIHYSMMYTSWSAFKELRATTQNSGATLFHKNEGFVDAYRMALGTTYYYDDNWTFRTGIAFDQSPIPSDTRSISIPDQNRLWLSAGTTYAFNKNASLDVGFSYMHGQSVTIKEDLIENKPATATTFQSSGKAFLYGANFNYTF